MIDTFLGSHTLFFKTQRVKKIVFLILHAPHKQSATQSATHFHNKIQIVQFQTKATVHYFALKNVIMNRYLYLVCITILLFQNTIAQNQKNNQANKLLPNTEITHYHQETGTVDYVQFQNHYQLALADFPTWLQKTFKWKDSQSLQIIHTETEPLDITHTKYQQYLNSYKIEGGIIVAHAKNGIVQSWNGLMVDLDLSESKTRQNGRLDLTDLENLSNLYPQNNNYLNECPDSSNFKNSTNLLYQNSTHSQITDQAKIFPTAPILKKITAIEIATHHLETALNKDLLHSKYHHFQKNKNIPPKLSSPIKLVYVPKNFDLKKSDYRLAYKIDLYAIEHLKRLEIYVDATTGEIVAENNRLCTIDVPATAETRYSGTRQITVDETDGSYTLQESGRNIITYNSMQSEQFSAATLFTDEDN